MRVRVSPSAFLTLKFYKVSEKNCKNGDLLVVISSDCYFTTLLGDDNYQTLGEKNFKIQFCNFNQAAQPYYVLLHPNHPTEPLVEPIGYDTNIQNFVDFLNNGKKEFEKK